MRRETQKHHSQWMKQRNEGREMPGEASHFAVVLERIARNALAQFRDISDVDLNSPLELPESNTAFVLATHLIGSAEYWVLELAGGRDVQRDRCSEFRATGIATELVARYERWLAAMQELLRTLPDERLDQLVSVPASYDPTLDEEPMTLRDALLHAVEHCALHQGHLELTRQLLGYAPAGEQ
ncbi:MAG: DinB family protein [Chloroflexi bacterium]|nr:MAG: DinB family protein [Chloroflexota bacterium]